MTETQASFLVDLPDYAAIDVLVDEERGYRTVYDPAKGGYVALCWSPHGHWWANERRVWKSREEAVSRAEDALAWSREVDRRIAERKAQTP